MQSGPSPIPFDPAIQALLIARRCSTTCAMVVQVLCLPPRPVPMNITELLRRMTERWRYSEEETRAGLAEAMLLGLVYTDGSDFRPGDAAFLWARVASEG